MWRKELRLIFVAIALIGSANVLAATVEDRGRARHVVLIVWDGMRPDFVTKTGTPNLWKLAQEGVSFRDHHSVYPSLTNVNGTVLATGVYPQRSGVIGNNEFRAEIDRGGPVDTALGSTVQKGDEVSENKYLAVPTIAELVQKSGRRTAIAGTKWIATLFDRARGRPTDSEKNSPTLTAGEARPAEMNQALLDSLGKFPAKEFPNYGQDQWTTAALTRSLWKDGVPAFSLLWLSDPDFSTHGTAPGAAPALAAIQHSDAMLGQVIDALESNHLRNQTDILVASDHGFSTIERTIDLPVVLKAAGFAAVTKFEGEPPPESVLVVGNGGTAFFYVTGHDETVTRRLVEWLQRSDFAGVIFARPKIEGTFTLAEAHLEKESGPDVVMAFRWNEKPNPFGVHGMIMADAARGTGQGTHATLSKFDLHNILFAAGPDFRRGYEDKLPSGNIDVAPTILHILGIVPGSGVDGRILSEAMTSTGEGELEVGSEIMEASREFESGKWRQSVKVSKVGEHRYFDEGNGAFEAPTR